jgi:hypothetical protein
MTTSLVLLGLVVLVQDEVPQVQVGGCPQQMTQSAFTDMCAIRKIRPQLTVAQPSEVRNSQPSRVEIPNTGNPDGSDLEQRLCPPSRRSRQCEDVDEGETLLVQAEEERGPEEVETELSVVEFERTDGDLAKEEVE